MRPAVLLRVIALTGILAAASSGGAAASSSAPSVTRPDTVLVPCPLTGSPSPPPVCASCAPLGTASANAPGGEPGRLLPQIPCVPPVYLQAGQVAVRGRLLVVLVCVRGGVEQSCRRQDELRTPEGRVRLTGLVGGLRVSEDVVAVGTWTVSGGRLSVDASAVLPVRPVCPPLPEASGAGVSPGAPTDGASAATSLGVRPATRPVAVRHSAPQRAGGAVIACPL